MVISIALNTSPVFATTLNDLLNQRDVLSRDITRNQQAAQDKASQASQLNNVIDGLTTNINNLNQTINDTQGKIDSTQNDINTLTAEIVKKENELVVQRNNQAETIRTIYETTGQQYDLTLVSGSSLSSAIDQAAYLESLNVQIETTMDKITQIRNDLSAQKSTLAQKQQQLQQFQNDTQTNLKNVQQQKSQKNQLLSLTLAQKKQYDDMVKKLQSEIANISAQIYAARQKLKGRESISSGSSGYPYGTPGMVDAWSFITGQCTSYAAWYWNAKLNKPWDNTRPGSGSAYNWPSLAKDQGYTVSNSPTVGAIVSWAGPLFAGDVWGHVAIVEGINNDGTIDITEMNWIAPNTYSYRKNVNPGDYGHYSYIY